MRAERGHGLAGAAGLTRMRTLAWRLRALVIGAWAWVTCAQPVGAGVQALLPGAHPLVVDAHAFVVRADPLCARHQGVARHHKSLRPRLQCPVMARQTMNMPAQTITIVLDRMCRHVHKEKSYEYRLYMHAQTSFIVFYRMCGHVNGVRNYEHRLCMAAQRIVIVLYRMCGPVVKEKTIVDRCAGVSGYAALTLLRSGGLVRGIRNPRTPCGAGGGLLRLMNLPLSGPCAPCCRRGV